MFSEKALREGDIANCEVGAIATCSGWLWSCCHMLLGDLWLARHVTKSGASDRLWNSIAVLAATGAEVSAIALALGVVVVPVARRL